MVRLLSNFAKCGCFREGGRAELRNGLAHWTQLCSSWDSKGASYSIPTRSETRGIAAEFSSSRHKQPNEIARFKDYMKGFDEFNFTEACPISQGDSLFWRLIMSL
jgi:hypothetical protein